VVGVHLLVEQSDRPVTRNFGSNGRNYRLISAFAEVGNALHELAHALSWSVGGTLQLTCFELIARFA
jgi:hypothetical protein